MGGFSASRENRDGAVVFRLQGPLTDADDCFAFLEMFRQVVRAGAKSVVLDLREMTRLSSGGVGILASCQASAGSSNANLCLFGLAKQPRTILEIVRLLTVMRAVETEDEALAVVRTG